MKQTIVLGVMSGTSLDGVDYVTCECSPGRVRLRTHWHVPFSPSLRARIFAAARGVADSRETAQLHHDLGRFYAAHARKTRSRQALGLAGLHGQTSLHNPHPKSPATFQLGEPAYLAEKLGVPVVSNFRAADLAAGGQGAPLATLFHVRAFGRRGRHVCVNNLGGISNVTSIDWRGSVRPRVTAFDTGPANILVDLAMRHFTKGRLALDQQGAWAARGQVSETLIAAWLKHPYFQLKPPKSTGREMFGDPFFQTTLRDARRHHLSRFDFVATLTSFTARSLVANYRMHLRSFPQDLILSGGGTANRVLVDSIRHELCKLAPTTRMQASAELGWPPQAIEPAAFAWLAWLRMRGEAGNLPETTGARRAVLCGQVCAGSRSGAIPK